MVSNVTKDYSLIFKDENAEIVKNRSPYKFIYNKSGVYYKPKVVGNSSNHIMWEELDDYKILRAFIKKSLRQCSVLSLNYYNPKLIYLLNTKGNWNIDERSSDLRNSTKLVLLRYLNGKVTHRMTINKGELILKYLAKDVEVTYRVPHALIIQLFKSTNIASFSDYSRTMRFLKEIGI